MDPLPNRKKNIEKAANQFQELILLLTRLIELLEKDKPFVPKNWLTASQVMEFLDCDPRTLTELREEARLPFKRVGNKFYYSKDGVEDLFDPPHGSTTLG